MVTSSKLRSDLCAASLCPLCFEYETEEKKKVVRCCKLKKNDYKTCSKCDDCIATFMFLSVYSCVSLFFSSALELLLNLYCEHVRRGQRPWL